MAAAVCWVFSLATKALFIDLLDRFGLLVTSLRTDERAFLMLCATLQLPYLSLKKAELFPADADVSFAAVLHVQEMHAVCC